jgi:hypothetical protein
MAPYTRREKAQLTPTIRHQYRELVIKNDLAGYEEMLALYVPALSEQTKRELIEEFKQNAAEVLARRWHVPK